VEDVGVGEPSGGMHRFGKWDRTANTGNSQLQKLVDATAQGGVISTIGPSA
jgi:hypothetical protein